MSFCCRGWMYFIFSIWYLCISTFLELILLQRLDMMYYISFWCVHKVILYENNLAKSLNYFFLDARTMYKILN
jgi:hypothetical protein